MNPCPICDLLETIDHRIKDFKKHYTIRPNQKYHVIDDLQQIVERHRKKEIEK